MNNEERLDSKIKRLFRKAGHPRWVHHMGPKKFETWVLCLGLIVKQVYQLSYRRAMRFLDDYFNIHVHWTTLQKAAFRLPKCLWQSLLAATITLETVALAAADGTGFARSGPSHYYLRRIDREGPVGRPVQLIGMVDVKKRKFLGCYVSSKPRGECKRIPTIHRQLRQDVEILLLDKGFDAEWLHSWLDENGTFSVAPVRKNCRCGRHRKLLRDCFDWCLYWQRNIVESLWSALKRLFGNSLRCRLNRTQTAELFCRLIAYNLGYRPGDFLQSLLNHKLYIS